MLRAILFDLDNTMVLFDEPAFYERYFIRIYRVFSDIFSPDEFRNRLLRATMALRGNSGAVNNRRFFMKVFVERYENLATEIWRRFMKFYEDDYDEIQVEVKVPSGLHAVISRLQQSGLKLVVASNPIFPLIVQQKRMAWAGIDRFRFDLVTHIENMSFVKPRLEYYLQICEKIGEAPGDCLMVGNDPINDMVAGATGMKTYLTTEVGEIDYTSLRFTVDEESAPRHLRAPDFSGPFADVACVVEELCDQIRIPPR
jgi:FMN phosphatase YigB (HAD superfamily)